MTDTQANLDAARERYRLEREKRLRVDGLGQFKELKGDYADFDKDPYVTEPLVRDSITEATDVVIVGAGFGGMMAAINLQRQGITNYRIIEKGGDFGGTWYWNRYPGCMCDVESYTYLPLLEETGYMPTEKYASAPEIFSHCQRIGKHFDLYEHALFETLMGDATWSDETNRWTITTSRDDQLTAKFLITAAGILHKAKLPGIPGIETYAGKAFHTSRWDYAFTGGSPTEPMDKLGDLRVGIIGTGATAIQAVPQLSRAAKEVFVFQRTPAAVGIRGNGPTDEEWFKELSAKPGWQAERMNNFTAAVTGEQPEVDLVNDGWTRSMWTNTQMAGPTPEANAALELADFEIMEEMRARVDELIDDAETAEKLKAWYGKHCKRLTFHDEYLQSFNKDNVHLVDTDGRGVELINETGVVVGGVEYPVDVLIFASGFEVTTGIVRRLGFDPVGRDGQSLSDRFADGAHTLHGILTANFPNLMIISTVQAGYGTNFVHFLSESGAHIARLIRRCMDDGIEAIEPTTEAEDEWIMTLWGLAAGMADYTSVCTPSYYNSEGQEVTEEGARNVTYPGSLLHYVKFLDDWFADETYPGTKLAKKT